MPDEPSQPVSSVLALRVPEASRGFVRVPLGGGIATQACVRCGARATRKRELLIDGTTYRYRSVIAVVGAISALFGPALIPIVPMLAFMSRQSRDRARIDVAMCANC